MLFNKSLPLEHSFGFIYLEWHDASDELQRDLVCKLIDCEPCEQTEADEFIEVEFDGGLMLEAGRIWNEISNPDRLEVNVFFRSRFEVEQKELCNLSG